MQLTRRQLLIAAFALGATVLVPPLLPAAPAPAAADCGLAALACRVAPADWGGIFAGRGEPA
jgi:hypothetical protein